MVYYESNELYHHGIKGQKWGVRRYQNLDGSLTVAGKTRYGRGKDLSKEHQAFLKAEANRLYNENKQRIKDLEDEAYRIAGKYGLDMDDGGGGDSSRWDEETLAKAGRRYLSKWDDIEDIENEIDEKAKAYADSKIAKKYGEVALSDINHYENLKTGMILGGLYLGLIGSLAFVVTH